MSDLKDIEGYFTRSAVTFDSLYSQGQTSSLVRLINEKFRRDIYERFRLSIDHVRRVCPNSVLDVGCGSGRYAEAFAQLGVKRIVGIDLSDKMIELARKRTDHSINKPEFVCGDFMEFSPSENFSVVVAMGFFDYVADPLAVLKRMRSLAVHSVLGSFPSISWYRTPVRRARYYFKRCPVYFYRREQVNWLGQAAGFARAHIEKVEGAGQDYFVTFSANHN